MSTWGTYYLSIGIAVDTHKLSAIEEWLLPQSPKALRGFLGSTGYYRKFVQGYEGIAVPLNAMLRKGEFKWSAQSKQAFEDLKKALISPPVLSMPDFEREFVLECDASKSEIKTVLTQNGHPIAYSSQGLKGRALSIYLRKGNFVHSPSYKEVEAVSLLHHSDQSTKIEIPTRLETQTRLPTPMASQAYRQCLK